VAAVAAVAAVDSLLHKGRRITAERLGPGGPAAAAVPGTVTPAMLAAVGLVLVLLTIFLATLVPLALHRVMVQVAVQRR
jgi:hypothetical protein